MFNILFKTKPAKVNYMITIFQSNNKYQLSKIQKNRATILILIVSSISLDSQTKETSTINHFIKSEISRASNIFNYVAN